MASNEKITVKVSGPRKEDATELEVLLDGGKDMRALIAAADKAKTEG